MRVEQNKIAFAYFRLSREEAQKSESSSITNQRMIVTKYCEQNGINLVREFVDDGYSGGNFDRPGFQEMMRELDIDEGIIRSTASHCFGLHEGCDIEPIHIMEKYLFATDELTGLIGAAARMRPSKSCQDMELKSVMKKYKTPAFAAGCSREVIGKGAEMLGITVDELCQITLDAMKALGL